VRGPLGRARNCGKVCNASLHPHRSESRRGPLTLVRYAHSTSPRTRGEVKRALAFSQRDPRRSLIHGEARIRKSASLSTTRHLLFSSLNKKGRQNADRRRSNRRACARRALSGARTPVGVPPRLSPEGIIPSQRLGFRPGFLGRGLNGRYPPSPVPVQGCTSHPGHNAGRHDAQAAREQIANPLAGTAPAPPHGLPPEGVLQVSRMV
jgi:hypothetical protein